MIYYKLNSSNPTSQYIQINIDFEPTNEIEKIQLPSWRQEDMNLAILLKT
jgi:hypothetical protein